MLKVIPSLCRSNSAILSQKIKLIDLLTKKHSLNGHATASVSAVETFDAYEMYRYVCPIVGASIGQHIRHSMDHIELAALVSSETFFKGSASDKKLSSDFVGNIHYDLRIRGGTLESDMDEARKRICDVQRVLEEIILFDASNKNKNMRISKSDEHLTESANPVFAHFVLSAEEGSEVGLRSTIERELAFAAHHAIHHMAMVKIIATNSIGIESNDLPRDFGRAPSTVRNEMT